MNRNAFLTSALLFGAAVAGFAQPASTDLPAGEQILQRFIDVTGGAAANDAVKNSVATGTFSIAAAGIKGPITIYSAFPDKTYVLVEIPGAGKMEEGSDGKIAWENSAMQGPRIKTGDEAAAAIRDGALDAHTNWKKYYKSAATEGIESVDGKTCYKVIMTPLQGAPETVYFDKETGLLLKQSAVYDTPMGTVPVEVSVSDFRKQDGVMLPFRILNHMAGQEFEIILKKFEVNTDIASTRFDLPAEIKALQK